MQAPTTAAAFEGVQGAKYSASPVPKWKYGFIPSELALGEDIFESREGR